jgi:peptide/nickel transport system substrate-binding protein/oligopeptide transport system substrate-binding protein
VIPDDAVALEKYLHGDFDFLMELPIKRQREMLERYPEQTQLWDMRGVYYIAFNHTKPRFKDNLALRKALNYAVNKDELCSEVLEDIPIPARGVLPPGFASFDETLEGYPYDPEKAKALLAEAGYPNGDGLPELTLQYNTSEAHEAVCEAVKNDLADVGVTVRLKNLEWATHLESIKHHEPELFRAGWLADGPSEDNFLQLLNTGRETNYSGYSNPEYDALFERARFATDPDERRRLYSEANRFVVEDAAWIFLYWYRDLMMVKPNVKGWVLPIQGDFRIPLHKVYFESPPGS